VVVGEVDAALDLCAGEARGKELDHGR